MFGSKKKTHEKTANSTMSSTENEQNTHQGISILAEGCHFQGKMFLRGTARIAGVVEGTVSSNHILIIEPSAKVTGQVNCVKILVCGQIDGRVHATDLVHLAATAKLDGDIEAPRFIIDDGAVLNGRLETRTTQPANRNISQSTVTPLQKAG